MSALGQKRTFHHSFDQLVGALLELQGYVEVERPGRLQVVRNSNLVDRKTGRSPGLAPLRI